MSYSLTRTAEGKSAPFLLVEFQMHENTFYRYTDTERGKTVFGNPFVPETFTCEFPGEDGDLKEADMRIELQGDCEAGLVMLNRPPSFVGRCKVWEGNLLDQNKETRLRFQGRVMSSKWTNSGKIELSVTPGSTELALPGKPHRYQRSCPHALYGARCRATRFRRVVTGSVGEDAVIRVSYPNAYVAAERFSRGEISWPDPTTGETEYRTIVRCWDNGTTLSIIVDYPPSGVSDFKIAMGCTRTEDACADWHNNIHNFGGQPFIPLKSPHNRITEFY